MFTSLATHLARLAVHRRRLVLLLSALALIASAALAVGAFGVLKTGGFDDPSSASSRAQAQLDARFGGETNLVLLLTPAGGAALDDPQVTASADRIVTALRARSDVEQVQSYWTPSGARPAGAGVAGSSNPLRASGGTSGLITMHVRGDADASGTSATAIIDAVGGRHGAVEVRAGGALGVGNDVGTQVGKDLGIAEAVAVPLTLVLLVVAFGSLLAALLPLAIALVAVAGTFAELFVLGSVTDVSIYAVNLTTALGLGLAVDYSLLIVSRFREELGTGADVETALVSTLRTAGRTVVFSSATVAAALSAMIIFPLYFLRSFAYAGIGVVIIAMLSALVTLPALLALLGHRVTGGRAQRRRGPSPESRFWRRTATGVMRHPLAIAVPVIGVLLVLGSPVLHIAFSTPDDRVLPSSLPSRQVGDLLREDYPGSAASAAYVVLQGHPSSGAVDSYAAAVSRIPGVTSVSGAEGSWRTGSLTAVSGSTGGGSDGSGASFAVDGVQYLRVAGPADTTGSASADVVHAIRALAPPTGSTALVGGATATLIDGRQAIADGLPSALLWIALTTLVLLFLFTGSVLLPLKALVLNGLNLTAVFGVVVWIFQDGHLSGVLGFTPTAINTSMPVLLFCIAFGLSMDYEVFLLSRIKELHDQGMPTSEAVAAGLARTGRIVTTAAALLSVTFFAFGLGKVSFIQLFGIGTGLAIVLDATIIRGLLVPAFMRIAGEANWWAPGPLRRLHQRIGLSESGSGAPAADSPELVTA